ncbi:sortase [Patescibacteria group bacterium]|nr:sortase [Patescibacteria group bacterium]MCL5091729.1 sortase [Patescibacteria group bacterium]
MAVYCYVKQNNSVSRRLVNRLSYLMLVIGAVLLFWSFYPIISFELFSLLSFSHRVSPVPVSRTSEAVAAAGSILGSSDGFSSNLRDFTAANQWFPSAPQTTNSKITLKEYTLSIPKLNISQAKVTVGGNDLSRSMVHYLPTSLPGDYGNVVIFCHSTLPQLYNVKDYKTICTYLPSLEKGDLIVVRRDNLDYEFAVSDMFVVDPDQVSVLQQKYDASYLTMITCVPPGTYWKRLVVRAKLTKLPTQP